MPTPGSAEELLDDLAEALEPRSDAHERAARALLDELVTLLETRGFRVVRTEDAATVTVRRPSDDGPVTLRVEVARLAIGEPRPGARSRITVEGHSEVEERTYPYSRSHDRLLGLHMMRADGTDTYARAVDLLVQDFVALVRKMTRLPPR